MPTLSLPYTFTSFTILLVPTFCHTCDQSLIPLIRSHHLATTEVQFYETTTAELHPPFSIVDLDCDLGYSIKTILTWLCGTSHPMTVVLVGGVDRMLEIARFRLQEKFPHLTLDVRTVKADIASSMV